MIDKTIQTHKPSNTELQTVDTFGIIVSSSSVKTFSVTEVELDVVPIAACVAWGLTLGNKVPRKKASSKNFSQKKQFDKAGKTSHGFDKVQRRCLRDGEIDQKDNQTLCDFFQPVARGVDPYNEPPYFGLNINTNKLNNLILFKKVVLGRKIFLI